MIYCISPLPVDTTLIAHGKNANIICNRCNEDNNEKNKVTGYNHPTILDAFDHKEIRYEVAKEIETRYITT